MVTDVQAPTGMVGAILLVSALIVVALAGGVVVDRLVTSPAAQDKDA